ncbi:guanylate kinase [Diplocarpon rosae]|nr:guanylate kinase [Diplocarpon rosae]
MAGFVVQMVEDFGKLLEEMLTKALDVKPTNAVEPPLNKSDLTELFARIDCTFPPTASPESKKHAIETAARESFNNLLASTTIDSPSFVNVWNLLDILSIMSDDDQTEPAVLFWLVEELLDSQTVAGCRKIFDYLESRRERIIAKNFALKNLVILRSCNELLRRLSRAEDTAFCGRVFIFLFQSFPLGDKSSVNLRGEYHTENVTTFDVLPPNKIDAMEVDSKTDSPPNGITKKTGDDPSNLLKGVTFSNNERLLSADELYPIFWALQQSFSQPKKLFDSATFSGFKNGLEATMAMFRSVHSESPGKSPKPAEEGKRNTKRKRGLGDDDLANKYNPKYLTSRDLFELEISDLSFRRHIILQALIVVDFLLSLSAKAKEKLSKATLPDNTNKSVMYADQLLNEEDTKWAFEMRKSIAEYLKQGIEGPYFHRMVENVLSRDKNWARWKIENCPSIAKPAITPQDFVIAKASARKATTNKRQRPNPPIGSLDLKFLSSGDQRSGLDKLKDPTRYQLPSVKSFKGKIELDDMDIDMAKDEESKNAAIESKASKSWRAQRLASTTQLAVLDKIERSDNIDVIFQDQVRSERPVNVGDEEILEGKKSAKLPKDHRPIVISGPRGAGKGTLTTMLLKAHEKSFAKTVPYTTRPAKEKEVDGIDYHFTNNESFVIMRDGDQFLEYNETGNDYYGTSRKNVESIIAQGKIPILCLGMSGVQHLKDQEYNARFIYLTPPSILELEARLRKRDAISEDVIREGPKAAENQIEEFKSEGYHDKLIINDKLDEAYEALEKYIFEDEEKEDVMIAASGAATPIVNTAADMANGDSLLLEEPLEKDDKPVEMVDHDQLTTEIPSVAIASEGEISRN